MSSIATSRTGTANHKRWRTAVLQQGLNHNITHCPDCGIWLDYEISRRPNSAEPDHIIPHAHGGQDTIDNGRVICRHCNQSRGANTRLVPRSSKKRTPKIPTIDFLA